MQKILPYVDRLNAKIYNQCVQIDIVADFSCAIRRVDLPTASRLYRDLSRQGRSAEALSAPAQHQHFQKTVASLLKQVAPPQ
jgi:hypothetical protein